MAGIGIAGQAVVRRFMELYAALALGSLALALLLPASGNRAVAAAAAPLYAYQQWVGKLDGRPCPSWPVCSLYGHQALEVHGLLIGSWLMLDRLIHEADDVRRGPWILADGGQRLYDPLGRNDYWLHKPDRE
ncbi:MAG: membrane protein insertion efficiency factor YidD [Mariprofundaceae bacterium]|nr:membrane protein insertion efficiency factor YidD [Mariprofundaceae bacterium]